MSPRILQVVTDTDRRGAQVFATDLHAALERRGREVRTVALAPGSVGGLPVPILGERRLGPRTLAALRREFKEASVAIAHGSATLPACAVTTWGTQVPFMYRQISDSRFWAPSIMRRVRTGASLRRASRVVALWSGSATTLCTHLGVRNSRIRIIPNGVSPDRFQPAKPDERLAQRRSFGLDPVLPVVLFLGALVPEKGADLAIEAVGATTGVQLLVVGDGPERPDLEAQAIRVAPGRVLFAGAVSEVRRAYVAADVVALPSRGGDSMPAVLIEAGLMGLPAVSTPVEAIPEIVVAAVTGELVPVDDAGALADAIDAVVSRPRQARELGRAARAHCLERFSIGRVADAWDEIVAELLGERRADGRAST
jgi:glycosyltransferase involved in cell wall biosynthesis